MTNIEAEIKEFDKILDSAITTTPEHLNGLLIPRRKLEMFYYLVDFLIAKTRLSEEYFKQINKSTILQQRSSNDFMLSLCKNINEGTIIFKKGG